VSRLAETKGRRAADQGHGRRAMELNGELGLAICTFFPFS
jgi:hypothetical protein